MADTSVRMRSLRILPPRGRRGAAPPRRRPLAYNDCGTRSARARLQPAVARVDSDRRGQKMDSGTPPPPAGSSSSAVETHHTRKRVLAVDDDPSILELIQILLESEGHEVVARSSGVGIVEQVRSVRPDLVLLDIVMQSRHGMEVLAEL